MYYTYVLKSLINNFIYVGSTEDVGNRLYKHNSDSVKSTKGYRPWILLESKEFLTRGEACTYEKFLKSGQQKKLLRKKYIKAQ